MSDGLNPYAAYKDSGVPWLGNIPEHWQVRKLRRLLKPITARNRPDLPLLSVVREKGVILRDTTSQDENRNFIPDDLSNYKVVRSGQFAMNKMKAWQGSYGVSRYDGIVSPAYFVFDLRGVEAGFFHTAVRSRVYVPFFTQASDGVRIGQWDLSQSRMKEIPVFVPPLPEQTAIVRFLGHADRRIRRYIRAKQKLIQLLGEQKRAIIHRAVTRGLDPKVPLKDSGVEWLGDVPEYWDVRRLKYVAESIQMGPFGASLTDLQSQDTGYKLFGQENTISGDFTKGRRWVTRVQYVALQRYELLPGDLVLTRKGSIGKCRIVPSGASRGIADSDTIRVRLDRRHVEDRFVVLLLQEAPYIKRQMETVQRGAILAGLNTATIGNLRVAVPPIREQTSLLSQLDAETGDISAAIDSAQREISLLREYRTDLIAYVVTGKLDVRELAARLPDEVEEPEPVDEPAALTDTEETLTDEIDAVPEEAEA